MNNSHLLLHILLNSSPDWLLDITVSQQVVSVCMKQLSHNMLFSIALTHTHTHTLTGNSMLVAMWSVMISVLMEE